MKISFCTLGCKVNQAESGAMGDLLRARGHEIVPPDELCDAVVINTCTVTAVSDQKSRQAIRRLRAAHPDAILAVCGCLPETSDLSGWDDIDLLGGSGGKLAFAERLEGFRGREIAPRGEAYGFESIPAATPEGRSRAFLKIQDGCENNCAYCIIPKARGVCRSRSPEDALHRAREAYDKGFRELVLTGIEISSYRPSLSDLIRSLCLSLPDMRFRIGSLDPTVPDAEFVSAIAGLPNVCPHFHLSVQSGCGDILRRMGRRYTPEDALASAARLREAFPGCAVTGDLICAFPGETEAQFEETLEFLKRASFSGLHVFPYSRRPGTPAAHMPNQLTNAEKRERTKRASEIAERTAMEYKRAQAGRTLQVLFESATRGLSENYQEVTVPFGGVKMGISPVLISKADGKLLRGEICR